MPSITPLTAGQQTYHVEDSGALDANVQLDINATESHFIALSYVAGTPGLQVEVLQPGAVLYRIAVTGTSGTSDAVPERQVHWTTEPPQAGTTTVLVTISETGGGFAIDEPWTVRARGDVPGEWTLSVDAPAVTVVRLLCDPKAVLDPLPASAAEKSPVHLLAQDATVGTVVGAPPAAVSYRFSSTGPLAMPPLPQCGPSPFLDLTLPGVYRETTVQVRVDVAYDSCDGMATAWLRRTSSPGSLTIRPRPQQVAIVVDRSGSMAGDRWADAVQATRMIVQLFRAFRKGVHPDDRIGVIAFEDSGCGFGASSVPVLPTLLPLSDSVAADAAICNVQMGSPGKCTPIGDALVAAMELLASGGKPADVRYTIILLTDGYENSGHIQVGPGALPAGVVPFSTARMATADRAFVSKNLALFTIGLGNTVDEPVLNNLPVTSPAGGKYLLVTDSTQLATAFGQMMSFAQEANPLPTTQAGDAVRFSTAAGAERLAVAAVASGTTVELRFRPLGSTGQFTVGPAARSCVDVHAFAVEDVRAIGIQGAIEWEVRKTSGTPPTLPATQVLAYEDLRVKADVVLDRPTHQVGGTAMVTVRLREGDLPLTDATVRVTVDSPAEGLGELLSQLGKDFRQPASRGDDPPTGKGALVAGLLQGRQTRTLARRTSRGAFVDGTDELHDYAGTGDFSNVFARFDAEGTYTWRVVAEGRDSAGEPFSRVLTLSSWAGIRVDGRPTGVELIPIPNHPSRLHAVEVVVTPRDAEGRELGPFWDHEVIFAVIDGVVDRPDEVQPRLDGTYRRTVLYRTDQSPRVVVKVVGTLVGPISLPPGKSEVKEVHKDTPKDVPKDVPKDPPKDAPKDPPKDPPKEFKEPIDDPNKLLPNKDRPQFETAKHKENSPSKDPRDDPGKRAGKDLIKDPRDDIHVKGARETDPIKRVPNELAKFAPNDGQLVDPFRALVSPVDVSARRVAPFTLATGAEAAKAETARAVVQAYLPVLAAYADMAARGQLTEEDLAEWQRVVTLVQRRIEGS